MKKKKFKIKIIGDMNRAINQIHCQILIVKAASWLVIHLNTSLIFKVFVSFQFRWSKFFFLLCLFKAFTSYWKEEKKYVYFTVISWATIGAQVIKISLRNTFETRYRTICPCIFLRFYEQEKHMRVGSTNSG